MVSDVRIQLALRSEDGGSLRDGEVSTLLTRRLGDNPFANRFAMLPLSNSSKRRQQWRLSRLALLEALQAVPPEQRAPLVSISHCDRLAVAIAAAAQPGLLGIGVDAEPATRIVDRRILQRLRHPATSAIPPLTAWCAREAFWKAIPHGTLKNAADIILNSDGTAIIIGQAHWLGRFATWNDDGVCLAVAWVLVGDAPAPSAPQKD